MLALLLLLWGHAMGMTSGLLDTHNTTKILSHTLTSIEDKVSAVSLIWFSSIDAHTQYKLKECLTREVPNTRFNNEVMK